jgi:hypothetical protein
MAQSFTDFLRDRVGPHWVLHRRTPRIVARYGEGVVCLSPRQYQALELEYEKATGLAAHGFPDEPAEPLRMAARDLLRALRAIVAGLHSDELNNAIRRADTLLAKFKDYQV